MDVLVIAFAVAVVAVVAAVLFQRSRSTPAAPAQRVAAAPKKQEQKKLDIVLYFGSQTGTAEGFANQIEEEASNFGLTAKCIDLEEFEPSLSFLRQGRLCVFMMATYGEGDPTDNAVGFMEWLSNEDDDEDDDGGDEKQPIKFTVFGLGNKQYENYNSAGKNTEKHLLRRGGECVYPLGLGDDDDDIEADFNKWKDDFWPAVCRALGVDSAGGVDHGHAKMPGEGFILKEHDSVPSHPHKPNPATGEYDIHHPFSAVVTTNRELYSSGRSCRHVEIPLEKGVTYHTGDHLGVLPENPPAIVDALIAILGLSPTAAVSVEVDPAAKTSHKLPFDGVYSVRDVLARCLEITTVVSVSMCAHLALLARSDEDKEALGRMASKEGRGEYESTIAKPMLTILEVLKKFSSVRPTLLQLAVIVPRLQVRYYSICSSHMEHPTSIHLCVAVVNYSKPHDRHHDGVCSTFLQQFAPNSGRLLAFVRKSTFHPPSSPTTPVILIGPGTGFAPLRGFLQDRAHLKAQGKELGECDVYYGSRHEKTEFLYKDEMLEAAATGIITNLRTGFSRDGGEKVYVQQLVRGHGARVWELLQRGAVVYVCGLVQMSKDVVEALLAVAKETGGLDEVAAKAWWDKLKHDGRFHTDVWT